MAFQEHGIIQKLLTPEGVTPLKAFAFTAASITSKCPPRRECIDAGFLNGTWIHRPHRNRSEMTYVTRTWTGEYERTFRQQHPDNTSQMSWNQYDWETLDACCPFYFFNAERMCETFAKLGIKRMLIIGDSIALQTTASLLGLMKAKGDIEDVRDSKDKILRTKMCGAAEEDFTLMYVRNDVLYTDEKQREDIEDPQQCSPWVQLISGKDEPIPDLLMVNVGPHVHDREKFADWIDPFSDYINRHYSGHLVYRTYPPGHPECWKYQGPADLDYKYDGFFEPERKDQKYYWWWQHYEDFNTYALNKLASYPKFSVLDVVPLARRRIDGHILGDMGDCLHYRLPGPPDWWMVYFYNLMEAMAFDDENIATFHQEYPNRIRV